MTVTKTSVTNTAGESTLLDKMISFGLSKVEAQVYLYLLQRGNETGGSNIATGTKLHRQYVYQALPKLLEIGLIEEVPYGKQSRYRARSSQVIETLGRKKAIEAGDLARELNLVSAIGNEQDFEVVQGQRAIQEYELMYAVNAKEGSHEYIIGGASESFSEVMGDTLDEYLSIKEGKNIQVKYLGTEDERPFYEKYISDVKGRYQNQQYRFMKKLPKGKTHMLVRENSVSFYTYLNPPLVYIVKSDQIADHYRNFFQMLWEMGEE